jgi:hypothetical protein
MLQVVAINFSQDLVLLCLCSIKLTDMIGVFAMKHESFDDSDECLSTDQSPFKNYQQLLRDCLQLVSVGTISINYLEWT